MFSNLQTYEYNTNENIIVNKNNHFDWREYLIANTDLIDGGINTKELATKHYYEQGIRDRRKIKSNFDWTQYIAINDDLIDKGLITKEKAQDHYISNGYLEQRRTLLQNFDWEFYIYFNNHLFHAGINTQTKAIKHWIEYGKSEGLITNIGPLRQNYKKIIEFDYNNIFDLFRNVYNVTLYQSSTISDKKLDERDLHYIEKRNNPYFKSLQKNDNMEEKIDMDIKEFILILDFPCFGGGCSFFLNTILSYYKQETNFLIVRNFHNRIYFYLNDEIIFTKPTNSQIAFDFLSKNKSKIRKVFFNSIVEHNAEFINNILDMNLDTTILTHDYSLFFKQPQLHYYDINESSVHYQLNIHKFNRVITQHIGNLHTFGKYMNDYNNIMISALPDYRNHDKKIINNNKNKFVIGILGDISDVKGYYILSELNKKIKNKKNIEIIVFGKVHIKDIKKQFSYHTINDLNHLLETHKPNIFIELSLWPESYSFTLTLAMITKLPIIYQNKFYPSTVQRRLSLYHNAYPFDNIEKVSLKWLLNKRQDYFFTIKPVIYYPPFWNYYFGKENSIKKNILNQHYNIVIITSKIYVTNKPLSYAKNRSIFSKEERYEQVQNTINSVRKYIPDCFILLYDNSEFDDNEFNTLRNLTDCFINHHNDEITNEFTDNSIHKLYGEIAQTYKMLHYLKKYYENINIRNMFKITGRYLINETFNFEQFDNDNNMFKRNEKVKDRSYFYTCFYKIAGTKFNDYYNIMEELYEDIQNGAYDYEDYEVVLPMLLYGEFEKVDHLGITQNISVWDEKSQI